jgi:2-polyprenyl-3-methyl-5-hydroxy-6-metoxy-1,4-benzoquinol methylase
MADLESLFGPIDIYLFDQLLKGRVPPGSKVLDAGCGSGRNLIYLLREGYEVFGADADPEAVTAVRGHASHLPADNFRVAPVEAMTFGEASVDFVISSAVLHFARDDEQFHAMLHGSWRPLKPGGIFFCRLASTIGIENQARRIEGRRFRLPDGSTRYLVDEAILAEAGARLGGELVDPLKTTIVQNQRAMTTWVMRKL